MSHPSTSPHVREFPSEYLSLSIGLLLSSRSMEQFDQELPIAFSSDVC